MQLSGIVTEKSTTDTLINDPVELLKTFTLEVLKIIKESQQQHGLRHSDYQRYRTYCTRRIRRLRKTLHFLNGNTRKYQKRDVTEEDLTDNKFLLIPLFQAERAWSHAMQLRQESNTEPRKKFHLLNRLRKAVKYAIELDKLSQSNKCDARTKLEAQGYFNIMKGQYLIETQQWKDSLKHFSLAKNIYEKLAKTLNGDDSQIYYLSKVQEIEPNIRYCNYNLGDEKAKNELVDMKLKSTGSALAENIDALISQTKEKQITTFSEVSWRNKINIQVKNEKVRLFLLNVQEFEKQIQSSSDFEVKTSIYENILKESVDVIQIVRDELKMDPGFQVLQRGQKLATDQEPSKGLLLFAYLTWLRINKTIERNLLMLESYKNSFSKQLSVQTNSNEETKGKAAKPQDIVRLYDIIIQNLKDIANLPGLVNDLQFQNDNEILIEFYKTFRAYYISLFYLHNKKYKEAVGFCFKVEKYIELNKDNLTKLNKVSDLLKTKSDLENQLKVLSNELNQSKYKIQTAAILEVGSDEINEKDSELMKEKLDKTPLIDRLDVYFEDLNLVNKNPNIVKFPLNFEPIPCKPLFFDLALNHLELPSLEDKIDSKKDQQKQGGLLKRFFGFK